MQSLDTHPVFSHAIYRKISKQKLDQNNMRTFWRHIGKYCALTRPEHNLIECLKNAGLTQAAEKLRAIAVSESGHGEDLETMAKFLIDRSTVRSQLKKTLTSLLSLEEMEQIFAVRKSLDPKNIPYNLGVTLALETLANQNIIPGEVEAFVNSGHYECKLTDPEMHYLAEHAGESGTEAEHEKLIIETITQLKDAQHIVQSQLTNGINDMCHVTYRFYEELSPLVLDI